ncbi:MAG: SDR family NAD(P)-dependent oxidoreductase [Nitrospira sp.]
MPVSDPYKKIVLITGASGGLGQVLCRAFATGGYFVGVHVNRNIHGGEKMVETLNARGTAAALFPADLCHSGAVRLMFDDILEKWGRIDLLINNAAIIKDRLVARMPQADWDDVIDLNLTGVFFCMREAGRSMTRQGGGHIMNIASRAALTGRVGQAAYAASKRGLIALGQTAAREWGGVPIQVNTILPGFLNTPMTAGLSREKRAHLSQENLLSRPATTREIAEFILDLSKMKHISGQTFNLDSRIV